ncbi:MAG: ATP synthase F0 subunit B [Holosporaceae bacterium]|jgi:F0F1-type ATP synthase membrane subunit b/b'|nr:ATP synthase F0 subunit B [Holosporaceae bacterium]
MTVELAVVVSFFMFAWIFMKKAYPAITKALDDRIESVKNKIKEAERLKEEATAALKEAKLKKEDAANIIEENKKASEEKIERLRRENELHLKFLREKFEESLKTRLEAELAKQKDALVEELSQRLIDKLSEKINASEFDSSIEIAKEDIKKLA